jgi:hypothetical protein
MEINVKKVAEEMVKNGINPEDVRNDNMDGWTDAFCDCLGDLESAVCEEVMKMKGVKA